MATGPEPPRSVYWVEMKYFAILENSFSSPAYWHGSKTTHPPAEPWDR